jgi:hypothetical protein
MTDTAAAPHCECGAPAEFRYATKDGGNAFTCAAHMLGQGFADGRLPATTPQEGEVIPPKREIAFAPITRKVECAVCGSEANATFHPTCNCNAGFRSKAQRVVEYDKANPGKSTRQVAADLGVHHSTVSEARKQVSDNPTPETVTGRDGKSYPAKPSKPKRRLVGYDIDESEQIEQFTTIFRELTWNGRMLAMKAINRFYKELRGIEDADPPEFNQDNVVRQIVSMFEHSLDDEHRGQVLDRIDRLHTIRLEEP